MYIIIKGNADSCTNSARICICGISFAIAFIGRGRHMPECITKMYH